MSVELNNVELNSATENQVNTEEEELRGLVSGLQRSNRRSKVLVAVVLGVALVGAALGVYFGVFHNGSSLTVGTETDERLDATFRHENGVTIRVDLENTPADQANVMSWSLYVGLDKRIEYDLDTPNMKLKINGHSSVLTLEEKQAMLDLSSELARHIAANDLSPQQAFNAGMLERVAIYFSKAPQGFAIPAVEFDLSVQHEEPAEPEAEAAGSSRAAKTMASSGDDGTTCLVWGGRYYAYFNQGDGGAELVTGTHRVGKSDSCIGRCGAGCNWFDKEAFRDCLDHDACGRYFGGSVLGDNPNCGDEFWAAADDYIVSYGWFC